MTLTFRIAAAADVDFVYRVVETTMRGYVEQTWGKFNVEGNKETIAGRIAKSEFEVIQFEAVDIGVLCVLREPTHIQLEQLFILPSHQNRGLGTQIVRNLAQEAKRAGKPLRLRVLNVNPAKKLYEREGFRVTSTTPE